MKKPVPKILSKIKNQLASKPDTRPITISHPSEKFFKSAVPKPVNQRDMRQEAMDMGSHQSKEFFGNDSSKRRI